MNQSGVPALAAKPSSSRWELYLIILLPFGGMAFAAWMYFAGELLPEGRNHKGNLLTTPLSLTDFQSPNLTTEVLDDKWGMLVVTGASCNEQCREILYLSRQSHIALNRDSTRMARYFISGEMTQTSSDDLEAFLEKEHPDMGTLSGVMPNIEYGTDESVRVFITDPFGNVMLWYGKDNTGKQMLKDMTRLLKNSRIG